MLWLDFKDLKKIPVSGINLEKKARKFLYAKDLVSPKKQYRAVACSKNKEAI